MLNKYGLYFAWIFSCLGTLGSLFFSDILHYEPCHLCWFQRIALFPLAIILGIGTYNQDMKIVKYALPLVVIGLFIGIYQILIQEIPGWNPINLCGAGPDCADKISIGLGPITLPILAATNFLVIGGLLTAVSCKSKSL